MKTISLLLISSVLILCGCGATSKRPMTHDAEKLVIPKVKVISIVKQEGLDFEYFPTSDKRRAGSGNGALGILIGSMIDSSINKKRVKRMEGMLTPYLEMLDGFDARSKIDFAIADGLSQSAFEVSEFISKPNFGKSELADVAKSLSEENLLLIYTDYSLGPYKNLIHVTSSAKLYKRVHSKMREIKSWKVTFQSPRRAVLYVPINNSKIESEIDAVWQQYDKQVEGGRTKKIISLRKKRDKKIKAIKAKRFTINSQPTKREAWNNDNLPALLNVGIDRVIRGIFGTASSAIGMAYSKKDELVIPASIWSIEPFSPQVVNPISGDEDTNYSTYLAPKNTQYIVPKGETLQFPVKLIDRYYDKEDSK